MADEVQASESTFSKDRREAARLQIIKSATNPADIRQTSQGGLLSHRQHTYRTDYNPRWMNSKGNSPPRSNDPSHQKNGKSRLQCTHCGMKKHTRETCFKIIDYPEWWDEDHRTSKAKGRVAVGVDWGGDSKGGIKETENREGDAAESSRVMRGDAAEIKRESKEGLHFNPKDFLPLHSNPSKLSLLQIYPSTSTHLKTDPPDFQKLPPDSHLLLPGPSECKVKETRSNSTALHTKPEQLNQSSSWIFDCGATDTMTYTDSRPISKWGTGSCKRSRNYPYYSHSSTPKLSLRPVVIS